jgi:drug/metabolite transporter (DMT)-like permease
MSDTSPYWFPAKRNGWGWGVPTVWQGWAVLAVFFCLLFSGAVWLIPSRGSVAFLLYTALLCVILMAVCWAKGEPPSWRWGKK